VGAEALPTKVQQAVEGTGAAQEGGPDIGDRVWHKNHAKQFPCLSSMLSFHMLKCRGAAVKADSASSSQTEMRGLDGATSHHVSRRSSTSHSYPESPTTTPSDPPIPRDTPKCHVPPCLQALQGSHHLPATLSESLFSTRPPGINLATDSGEIDRKSLDDIGKFKFSR
jgi:hypothetical protein